MVNAQRFRARKVDLKRPLPVFRAADLDDLEDDDNRHADAIETGVEKDEEAEHHLQAAISATHAAATGEAPAKQVYIPTPDASKVIGAYDELYLKNFSCPTSLIRSSETVEESCAPQYCMDDDDAAWLGEANAQRAAAGQAAISEDQFEVAMDQLEAVTRDMVFQRAADMPTAEFLAAHAQERDRGFGRAGVDAVFEHWKQRRIAGGFKAVVAGLQMEDTSRTEMDPYVCFRRREVRQGRKTRRADQRSLEQLRRLRVGLAMSAQMLDMCLEREAAKTDAVAEAQAVARQRVDVLRMRRKLGATAAPFDDLFEPPQPPRKRVARDAAQRPRVARKPRVASGLASAAAERQAAAGGAGLPGCAAGAGDPVLPAPYVLPRTVTVHQYPAPRALQAMAERVAARALAYETRVAAGWVDATFASVVRGGGGGSGDSRYEFWAPHGGATAFRMRRGRAARLFLDRRAVRAQSVPSDRQEKFRMALLQPEDHVRLLARVVGPASGDSSASGGIPEDLLRPFSFSAELLMSSLSVPSSVPLAPPPPPPPLSLEAQFLPPLPRPLAVSAATAAASLQHAMPANSGALSDFRFRSPYTPMTAVDESSDSENQKLRLQPPPPALLKMTSSAPNTAVDSHHRPHQWFAASSGSTTTAKSSPTLLPTSPSTIASTKAHKTLSGPPPPLPLNVPALVSAVSSPALVTVISPQLGSGPSQTPISNGAK
ncbi:Enhancer of polycomb-like protein 1 [Coemansia thaxteri]|uniref:Enhancer of polycomb-like protein n=1 Tax=Coemansia thaxteri TaxID=2663907 RepID=A0A9W8BES0_9FUNG|nr:Enhancer of polycomb-like protein 1 [Coemansia thaxteri]